MTNDQILELLFPGNLSIGQMEEMEETREMLKDESDRQEILNYAMSLKGGNNEI